MARQKGMGSLQREKSGRYTLRVGLGGKRLSRSTGTCDLEAAERFAQRLLRPLGLGAKRVPLAEVWYAYERSPKRRDLAPSTLHEKRIVWMHFARWMEQTHLEVSDLAQLTSLIVGEYLQCLRIDHCATTYNNHVCVLREICRIVGGESGCEGDPWDGVRLMCDDSHPRRAFTTDELMRILKAAEQRDAQCMPHEYKSLILIGIYTGLRLGDCCTLSWKCINLERGVIQIIPQKTRKHAHGHPVTIPIHPALRRVFAEQTDANYVLPTMAAWYLGENWRVGTGLKRIFRAANITTSVRLEGRRYKAPEATFHSLRHTFVSLAANAGVPLTILQSIVGHESSAMTRHYYHENEAALQGAIAALPSLEGDQSQTREPKGEGSGGRTAKRGALERLQELEGLLAARAITEHEYQTTRVRVLSEV